ncbi:MAG: hypothetical protein KGH64_04365 [Candidatus Micrarchaeota archaeon]|nr:hypothetical protein [Candidatus Micrarchaeota archaeon]
MSLIELICHYAYLVKAFGRKEADNQLDKLCGTHLFEEITDTVDDNGEIVGKDKNDVFRVIEPKSDEVEDDRVL